MLVPILRPLLRRTGIDRAVSFGILTKCWQVPAGVVTMLLIALWFDPETQGVYYTIFGILGLQNMAEAGLTSILMHAISHEWSQVKIGDDGRLDGDSGAIGRIASLAKSGVKWLLGCSVLFAVVAMVWGLALFRHPGGSTIGLVLVLSVILSAMSLVSAALVAVLEGCNQVGAVNRNRLGQAISGSIVVWTVILAGGSLWAIVASLATQLIWELNLLVRRYGRLFVGLTREPAGDLDWKTEVWPLQWKLGLQGFVQQLAFTPIIPVLYASHGAAVAGQAGMTLNSLVQLLGVASMWIRTRAPDMGEMIAQRKFQELDQLFRRTVWQSTCLLVSLVGAFCVVLIIWNHWDYALGQPWIDKLAMAFVHPTTACWIAAAMVPLHLMNCMAIYLRSGRVDPLWRITIASNLLLAAVVIWACDRFGAIGIGTSMTLIYGGLTLPGVWWAWQQFKRDRDAAK